MGKETKFNYGSLAVGIGVPFLIERLTGPKWGLIAAIVFSVGGCILIVLSHTHHERNEPPPIKTRVGKMGIRLLLGGVISAGIVAIAWAYSVNQTPSSLATNAMQQKSPTVPNIIQPVNSWGKIGKMVYADVDMAAFSAFAKNYDLMLIVMIEDSTVDYMRDGRIAKSKPFTITGGTLRIEAECPPSFWPRTAEVQQLSDGRRRIIPHYVFCYLVAWPKLVSTDKLQTLSDVEMLSGKILAKGGFGGSH